MTPRFLLDKAVNCGVGKVVLHDRDGLYLSVELTDAPGSVMAEIHLSRQAGSDTGCGSFRLPIDELAALTSLLAAATRVVRVEGILGVAPPPSQNLDAESGQCDSEITAQSLGWTPDDGIDPDTWLELQLAD